MRRASLVFASGLTLLACGLAAALPAGARAEASSGPGAPAGETLAFRLTLGLKDEAPRAWDGRISSPGHGVREVVPARFRKHERNPLAYDRFLAQVAPAPAEGAADPAMTPPAAPGPEAAADAPASDDAMLDAFSWRCRTRYGLVHGPTTEWTVDPRLPDPWIEHPALFVSVDPASAARPVAVETVAGNFAFVPADVPLGRPAEALDGAVRIERVLGSAVVAPREDAQQDYPSVLVDSSDALWVAWQEYDGTSDRVRVGRHRGGSRDLDAVLVEGACVFRTALAQDARGRVWVVWSMQDGGRSDLFGRAFDGQAWTPPTRLSGRATRNLHHRLATDAAGTLWLVWTALDAGFSQIHVRRFDGETWTPEEQLSTGPAAEGNNWWPAIAAGPRGGVAVAWDGYAAGSYDIYFRLWRDGRWTPVERPAASARFEAHPTVAIDSEMRVWLAWNESGEDWGKDTGFLVEQRATQLRESRWVRVACRDGDRWRAPAQPVSTVLPAGQFWELPHLQIDGTDRPWLFVRTLVMREPDTPLEGPIDFALWEMHATRFDGAAWGRPVPLQLSTGRNDMLPSTGRTRSGDVWAAWATDGRDLKRFLPRKLDVRAGRLEPAGAVRGLELVDAVPEVAAVSAATLREREEVRAVRGYRVKHRGKSYAVFRGDLHRHTDISHDGANDGSLLDAYRYARDAAALDFVGVSDHTEGADDAYSWWRTQKVANLFQVPGAFAAFYGYERSVPYPNGHRNIFFAERGRPVLLPGAFERVGVQGAAKLYEYLLQHDGFSIPHTTGRTSGTDWRDHDPRVENLVELFQGMRDTYEHVGAPRPKRLFADWIDPKKPVPRASSLEASPSFKPLGFVWKALEKGHHLGFIASSDHISTHISYAFLIAEELTPAGLLEAVRARRAYAATDNILLDVRHHGSGGEHLMGEIFASTEPVRIEATIAGTDEILQVDLIKDGAVIDTVRPAASRYVYRYVDRPSRRAESHLYLRVLQRNGEIAWGSPVWVTYRDRPAEPPASGSR